MRLETIGGTKRQNEDGDNDDDEYDDDDEDDEDDEDDDNAPAAAAAAVAATADIRRTAAGVLSYLMTTAAAAAAPSGSGGIQVNPQLRRAVDALVSNLPPPGQLLLREESESDSDDDADEDGGDGGPGSDWRLPSRAVAAAKGFVVSVAAARVGAACVEALGRMAAHRSGAGEVAAAAAGNALFADRVVALAKGRGRDHIVQHPNLVSHKPPLIQRVCCLLGFSFLPLSRTCF